MDTDHVSLAHEDALRWIVMRYAHLRAAHGEALGEPELLTPTGEHFPDAFERDAESVDRLLRRMLSYAPLHDDLGVSLRFFEPDDASSGGGGCGTGGCGSGACATPSADGAKNAAGVHEVDDGYLVDVAVTDVGNATVLTTSLARSVGTLVLAEAGEEIDERELAAMSELAALACGFGVLLVEGAHIYGKSCGGVRMHQATSLSLPELAVSLALFLRVHELRAGAARKHLSVTQAEAFDRALEWVDSNPEITKGLREHPEALASGLFSIKPVRGLLGRVLGGRLFGRKDEEPPMAVAPAKARKPRSAEEQRRLDEARALVDEALREGAE